MVLLEISSLQALFRYDSFGSLLGDYQFTALAALWLSRFLILRWVVTWEPSTSQRPTFWGVVTHWMTSHVMAGQYFDRPSPHVVAKQIGMQHYHGNFEGRQAGGTRAAIRDFLWPSLVYTWRYLKTLFWYPLLALQDRDSLRRMRQHANRTDQSSSSSRPGRSSSQRKICRGGNDSLGGGSSLSAVTATTSPSYYVSYASKLWVHYGPPLQMIITIATFTFFLYYGFFVDDLDDPLNALTMQTHASSSGATVVGDLNTGLGANVKAYGAYKRTKVPNWGQVLFYLSFGGTVFSLIMYGRIVLPIPDLVAGSNVLKSMRNEAKHYHQQQHQPSGSSSGVS